MKDVCRICSTEAKDELHCSRCAQKYHFNCGTGLSNVSFRTITKDAVFLCPICCLGANNALVHAVITANQVFLENKHATHFDPGDAFKKAPQRPPPDAPAEGNHAQEPNGTVVAGTNHQQQHTPHEPNGTVVASTNLQEQHAPAPGASTVSTNTWEHHDIVDPSLQQQHNSTDASVENRPKRSKDRPPPKPLSLPDETMAPLHKSCTEKAKQLIYRLGTLRRAP